MKIQEACRLAGVTRKAALVAADQGLIAPARLENGYRDFSPEDVTRLQRIAVLRGLGLAGDGLRAALDGDAEALRRAAMAGRLRRKREEARQAALERLAVDGDWEAARSALEALQAQETIAQRLLDAFPGMFGQYLALHFSAFLNEPLTTAGQRDAFAQAVAYLDGVALPSLSPAAQAFLDEAAAWYTPSLLASMHDAVTEAAGNPQAYLDAHGQEMDAWRQARACIPADHPVMELWRSLAAWTSSPGYQEVFLPALRRMSPAYDRYCRQLAQADAVFTQALHP